MHRKLSESAKEKRTSNMSLVVNSVFAATSRGGWFGGAKAHHGNPYDDHTLKDRLQPVERVAAGQPECAFVDRGYRGHNCREIHKFLSASTCEEERPKVSGVWVSQDRRIILLIVSTPFYQVFISRLYL
jgi:hypothetical protein